MSTRSPTVEVDEVEPVVLQWPQFQAMFMKAHKQGEHVSIVGPTGSGKSVLELEIAKLAGARKTSGGRPSRVVVLGVKPADDTLMRLHKDGWPIIKTWPPSYGQEHCIVWPRSRNWPASKQAEMQRKIFEPLLDEIYTEGGQAVCIDEAAFFERDRPKGLGLGSTMENFWSNSRSNNTTLIAATQRPRHVTLLMWSEPSWVIIFKPKDLRDLETVGKASGHYWEVMTIVRQLGGFEFVCVRRQNDGSNEIYVSKVEIQNGVKSETKTDSR